MGIDCIKKNNGVIIADVVGLGKSIIASAIAYNFDVQKCVIIAPPHLVDQWSDYQQDFGLRGVKIYSSGKIDEVYKNHADDSDPILYIIDEAHRYRNELSNDYQLLHQITRSNSENKVILLTATPYNNRPADLFALIKLFQTPSRSTINSVDNLGIKFRELISTYNKLAKDGKRNLTPEIRSELGRLSDELRILIDPVIVRRSRIDLSEIKEYSDDLRTQGVEFPEVIGPNLIEYDLGKLRRLYIETLDKISNEFTSSRYNPSAYLKNPAAFNERYGELFGEINIQLSQSNLAQFIRRLLVMRFESSKAAFKSTLSSLLASYESIKKWWNKGYVPIQKSGYLSDPNEEEIQETLDQINNDSEDYVMDLEKIKKKAIPFEKGLFNDNYIIAIEKDISLLRDLYEKWFDGDNVGLDPKYNNVASQIDQLLNENPNRKIVIFSSFADTAEYVFMQSINYGFRSILYTGSASAKDRYIVKTNFDASMKTADQKNDYDIIVATDALSEGFNLNRAGVIINYDIPYNPTRVVQRIGRINRINKMMFKKIYIYNLFPTDIGETNTLIKGISTLKMLLINNIVGSDTKTLTPDETLQSYFKRQFTEANREQNEKSWDIDYKNDYDSIKHHTKLIEEVKKIPERVRIVRKYCPEPCVISFAKRGTNSLFALGLPGEEASIVPPNYVLKYFKATEEEKSYESDPDLDLKFTFLRNEINRPLSKIRIDKRKGQALENIEKLILAYPIEKDYLNDLKEIILNYDDLSDGELKFLSMFRINKQNAKEVVIQIKMTIPTHYIIQIKKKVESIDTQTETIMFTEDLRNVEN
jgi:superfamily II DNA or RNA helicase